MSWFDASSVWLSSQLGKATGGAGFALLLLGGALASLLPCVYPLYPITAAFLSKRESKLGRFAHPLSYYLGLAAIYFTFGIIASLTGGSFNDILRQPSTNLAIGGLMILLALATAGLLHLPGLASAGGRQGVGLGNTFMMGAGAGLLSSACVGPVVVSILVSIASGTSRVTVGGALVAAIKMMLFGIGVGLPLLLIGVFGMALPKAGAWMVRVQQLLGLVIAWFATGYLFKGLAGVGLSEDASRAILSGIALVGGAAFLIQSSEAPATQRTKRAVLAVVFVIGFFIVGKATLGTMTPALLTAGPATPVEQAIEQHGNLGWFQDRQAAYAAAAKLGKPVFIDFHGDWCTNCKAFQELTVADAKLNSALQNAVLLKVRDTTSLFEEYQKDSRFPELKVGLPFIAITDAKGTLLYKTSDYTKSDEMALFLL